MQIAALLATTPTAAEIDGVRALDLAAFGALALVWLLVAALLYGLSVIIRERAAGRGDWGASAGL
ncbi:MAG: hypothetical protein R3A51_21450 [Nannocystaceae bacterium]|nr:hypothetical protein [Myxococcales bacterium]